MKGRGSIALGLAVFALLAGCAGSRPIDQISDRGHSLYKRGDYTAAAAEFQQITDRYPGEWQAQYMLGKSLLALGEINEARRALEIAHTRRPSNGDVADALAQAMLRGGDENTLFAFLRARARSSQSVDDYLRLAKYSMELDDPDSARLAIDTAIKLNDGRTVKPYLYAADLAQHVGDLDQAVRRLHQAYAVNPRDPDVRNRLQQLGEVPGPTLALPPDA